MLNDYGINGTSRKNMKSPQTNGVSLKNID